MSHLGSRSQGIKRVKIKRTRTKVSWILRVNLCDLTVLDSKETSPCKMKPRILSLQGTWIVALSGNGISSKACRDRQQPIGFSRIGETFPKMTHTFPMIKSKGLKLQTANISSGLSTRLFVFRMPSNFKVYLTKAGHYRQFDCSFLAAKHYQISWDCIKRDICLSRFFNVQDPGEKHPATFFYLFLFVSLFSFLQCGRWIPSEITFLITWNRNGNGRIFFKFRLDISA